MKRLLILVHRWLGVALCVLFLIWFPSGIGMMYWGFPDVTERDRLDRAPALDAAAVRLSPAEAWARLGIDGAPRDIRLQTFDGRPVYRFPEGTIYADTGDEQTEVSNLMVRRMASAWTGQPIRDARVERIEETDQWLVQQNLFELRPLWKFSWPNGEQVYVSQALGEVVQYTTTGSRLGAYLGPIPHWFYITGLRKHGPEWSRIVIWSSGIGTIAAILGVVVGAFMYSPSKRYRYDGTPSSIPYRGQKRWHMVFGLVFGIATITWAFSGMLSMDPFPRDRGEVPTRGVDRPTIQRALHGEMRFAAFAAKHPADALRQLEGQPVMELELTSFAGEPIYLAHLGGGQTRIVPLSGTPFAAFDAPRIVQALAPVAGPELRTRVIDQYDRYYLDRRRARPLPVILAELNDEQHTRFYIDPATAQIVGSYSDRNWVARWLYNGLHSLNFPWLYNYRPLWDIVVIAFMLGGTALSVTSLVLAWRVIGRKLRGVAPGGRRDRSRVSDDLALVE